MGIFTSTPTHTHENPYPHLWVVGITKYPHPQVGVWVSESIQYIPSKKYIDMYLKNSYDVMFTLGCGYGFGKGMTICTHTHTHLKP